MKDHTAIQSKQWVIARRYLRRPLSLRLISIVKRKREDKIIKKTALYFLLALLLGLRGRHYGQ